MDEEGLYKFDVYQVRMNVLALMKLFRHKQELSSQCRSSLVLTLKAHEAEWPRQFHQEDDYPADSVFVPD